MFYKRIGSERKAQLKINSDLEFDYLPRKIQVNNIIINIIILQNIPLLMAQLF
jgi:hypothetical protein